jgi:hypothetical protein
LAMGVMLGVSAAAEYFKVRPEWAVGLPLIAGGLILLASGLLLRDRRPHG